MVMSHDSPRLTPICGARSPRPSLVTETKSARASFPMRNGRSSDPLTDKRMNRIPSRRSEVGDRKSSPSPRFHLSDFRYPISDFSRTHAQSSRPRNQPVPAATRQQPRRLEPLGTRGDRAGQGGTEADLPFGRRSRLPLLPRRGPHHLHDHTTPPHIHHELP